MKRISGIVAIVLGIVGIVQIWSGIHKIFPSLGQDSGIRASADDAMKAADEFTTLAKGSADTGNAPRETDPAVKPLLDRVLTTRSLTSKPLSDSDLGSASDWNGAVLKVGLVYIFAGTGIADPARVTADPKLVERVNQNVVTFAPEMGRYIDAQEAVVGATADTVEASLADGKPANDQVKSGLAKVRGGITSTITGVLSTLTTDGLSDDWRRERLPSLQAVAPKVGKLLLPDQCRTVRDTAAEAAQVLKDAAVQDGLKAFGQALGCAS